MRTREGQVISLPSKPSTSVIDAQGQLERVLSEDQVLINHAWKDREQGEGLVAPMDTLDKPTTHVVGALQSRHDMASACASQVHQHP